MLRYRTAVLALLLAALPSTLEAQGPVTFTINGFGGVFLPASDLFDEVFPGIASLSFGHETGFNAGGRVAVWPTRRIGIEAEGSYVGSDVEITGFIPGDTTLQPATVSANVFYGSLNVVFVLFDPPLDPIAVFVSGGVGLVSRSGDFFDGFEDEQDIAGVAGIGLRYGVAPRVRIRVDLRDYISSFEETAISDAFNAALGTDDVGSKLQNDLLVSAGVEIVLGSGG